KNGMEERPLAFKYSKHKNADRFCDGEHKGEENHDLGNAEYGHVNSSKAFWPKQRVHQIDEQKCSRNSCNCVFHSSSLEALGGLCEAPHQRKENEYDSDIKNIQHGEPHSVIVVSNPRPPPL